MRREVTLDGLWCFTEIWEARYADEGEGQACIGSHLLCFVQLHHPCLLQSLAIVPFCIEFKKLNYLFLFVTCVFRLVNLAQTLSLP